MPPEVVLYDLLNSFCRPRQVHQVDGPHLGIPSFIVSYGNFKVGPEVRGKLCFVGRKIQRGVGVVETFQYVVPASLGRTGCCCWCWRGCWRWFSGFFLRVLQALTFCDVVAPAGVDAIGVLDIFE